MTVPPRLSTEVHDALATPSDTRRYPPGSEGAEPDGGPLSPARGIGWAILISCIIWGAVALIVLAWRGVAL